MRILIDMQGAQTRSRFRGIGRYSMAIARAIVQNAGEHKVWIVLNSQLHGSIKNIRTVFEDLIPADHIIVFDVPPSLSSENPSNVWRRRAAELIRESFIEELQPDVVYITSLFEGANDCHAALSISTLSAPIPTAVTLYDLIPLLNQENYLTSAWDRQWYMDKVANLKRADLLLSISEHSRQEAIGALGIEGERIVTISTAHTTNFHLSPHDEVAEKTLFCRYNITAPYIMYNGALESRKNLDRLLMAFSLLPSELRHRHQLVFVGKVAKVDHQRLVHLSKKMAIHEQFILTGHVPDEDLVALFSHCTLFVFPSLHEGFGLPALEAMACGAPTIGSNVTSIPEVIGRTDALFDPTNPEDIAAKIIKALTDLDFRQSLRQHALVQASKFSWDICAKRAIAAFEQLYEKTHSSRPSKPSGWTAIAEERDQSYRQLIKAIAAIPCQPIVPSEEDLILCANCIANNRIKTECIARANKLPEHITWRIEGPFDSSYSLALLNRETALALHAMGHQIVLHSTEGPGDFPPNANFLLENPLIATLYARSREISSAHAEVTSRNLYPPRVADMNCRYNLLHHYAWEESGFPREWVEAFNEHLQGITCLSRHVEKIMIDHGVTVPMSVSGCGVDHWERIEADKEYHLSGNSFRFLHVSSCFPRKGADLLLKAYGQVFTSDDDVTLVIKTFPNPHNQIHQWLANVRMDRDDFPDVLIVEEDLTDPQLKAIYRQCHALVAPSKAEGFGLPMAEAMLSGLAVITTGWGGQLDFCTKETAWLIDYSFEAAKTHFGLFDSVWAVPDVEQLAMTMLEVYDMPADIRQERASRGREILLEKFRWPDVATRLVNSTRTWAQSSTIPEPHIGWVSTWNTCCGIASYSAHLVDNIPSEVTLFAARTEQPSQLDGPEVLRCWTAGDGDRLDELTTCIEDRQIDTLVVQFNYSFFNIEPFGHFLSRQLDAGRRVVLMMHSTSDPVHVMPHQRLEKIRKSLARCHRLLVHAPDDLNRLKALGLVDNVTLFPHGICDYTPSLTPNPPSHFAAVDNCWTIASYGFFLPHKGLLELIEAVALLNKSGRQVRLHMVNAEYPVPESAMLIEEAGKKIASLGLRDQIQLTTDFLPEEESLALLAKADLLVFPYQNTGESSSAAVRNGLATGRPVAVTPLSIFDDVVPAAHILPGCTPDDIAQGIGRLLQEIAGGTEAIRTKETEAARWREAHRFTFLGRRLYGMLQALSRQ